MIKLPNKNKKGFTLVELMIVITVIAILATIAVVSFTRVQKQARDTKRKAEIKSLQTALQAYFTEKNTYPVKTSATSASAGLTGLTPSYISSLPAAPQGTTGTNTAYMYVSDSDGYKYALCVDLESAQGGGNMMWKVDTNNAAGREVSDATCAPDE